MKYTSKDIAKKLGVSPATISLVINNKPGVSNVKRKEIIRKIQELECEYLFKNDVAAKGNIGFVVYKCKGEIVDEFPFFNYLLENINKTSLKANYELHILYLDNSMSNQTKISTLENSRCTGFLVYAVEMYEKDLEVFHQLNKACVFMDNSFRMREVDAVVMDNYLGVHQAVEYLYNMGHRKIGYIKSRVPISSFDERFDAFQYCLKEFGLEFNGGFVMKTAYAEKQTKKDVVQYLEEAAELPTAFFADNDLLACRAVQGFKEMGLLVPDDVSVMGFDNRPICEFTEPPVTTVEIPRDEMGRRAIDILLSRFSGKQGCSQKVIVGTKLKVRDSVKSILF